jgi:fatty acid kinase fatty acid binding subunit
MARVVVVTDSSACVASPLDEAPDALVLPISIHVPTRDIQDGDPEAAETVYDQLTRDEAVKSSAPSPIDYLAATEDADGDGVVIVTPAREFTVMFQNAQVAAAVSGVPVAVVDSRTAAAAQGLVVRAACESAARGDSLDDVVEAAEEAARATELVAVLDGVETLRRSGHVQSVLLDVSDGAGLHPVFRLKDGAIQRLGICHSRGAALRRIKIEALALGWSSDAASVVFHAAASDRAEELMELLGGTDLVTEFSPSMGIHTGPGVVGVAWLRPS